MMLNELLESYWQAAFDEANKNRDNDTIDHLAQRTLIAIHAEVKRLVEAEREACADVCKAVREQDVNGGNDSYLEGRRMGATVCMNAIKMRSNVKLRGSEAVPLE